MQTFFLNEKLENNLLKNFNDFKTESNTLLTKKAVTWLASYGVIKVSGEDAESFLQSQFSCNIKNLEESKLGCYCNTKGRVQFLVRFVKKENDFYLQLPKDLIEKLTTELKKYVFIADVEIEYLEELKIIAISNLNVHYDFKVEVPGIHKCYYLYGTKDELNKVLKNIDATPIGEISWRLNNIKCKIPEIFDKTFEKFLPHNIDLARLEVIDFKKGCYRGQEIISRVQYRGNVKYSLAVKEVDYVDDIIGKEVFVNDKKVGRVVLYSYENEKKLALLELHNDYQENDDFIIK